MISINHCARNKNFQSFCTQLNKVVNILSLFLNWKTFELLTFDCLDDLLNFYITFVSFFAFPQNLYRAFLSLSVRLKVLFFTSSSPL